MFHIQGLDKVYNKEADSYELPNGLTVQLYSHAYTHARALLASELSATSFRDKYFLPILNPSQFIRSKKTKISD